MFGKMLQTMGQNEITQREKQREIYNLKHSKMEVQTSTDNSEGIDQETREKIREWATIQSKRNNLFQTLTEALRTKGWELGTGFGKMENVGVQRVSISF